MTRIVLACAVVAALAGCADTSQPLSPSFGSAVSQNIAAQVVNPTPSYATPHATSGARAAGSVERYRAAGAAPPPALAAPLTTGGE